jgi:hypothetical protein
VLGDELASVPLMWSEARASLHLALLKTKSAETTGRSSSTALRTARLTESNHRSWVEKPADRLGFVVTLAEL